MNQFLESVKRGQNFTTTENGAIAYESTLNPILDAFGSLGAMKDSDAEDIVTMFSKAYATDKPLALRLLFYMRDIRGGQGMRRVFRIILKWLAMVDPEVVKANYENIIFFGRGDDYLCLLDTQLKHSVAKYLLMELLSDEYAVKNGKPCSLLAKWLPSEQASSVKTRRYAYILMQEFKMKPRQYRQMLSALRKEIEVVERYMSNNEWDKIKFEKVPSRASLIYSDAFEKHCEEEYINYLKDVAEGKAKVNAGALFPVDIVHKVYSTIYSKPKMRDVLLYEGMWNALPNYFEGLDETGICVVDVSGSMNGTPLEVALSLGMYCADKCKGPFKDHFFTFSSHPKLQKIIGVNIIEKLRNMNCADWGMNTNLEAVFDLMLNTAVKNHVPQSEMPNKLYIISDMQFDFSCTTYGSNPIPFMNEMTEKYKQAGYEIPSIVYWNVRQSDCGMYQATYDSTNVCMVSGYSPSLFKAVIEGTEYVEEQTASGETTTKQKLDPMTIMLNTLNNERYDRVKCA